MKNTKNTKIYLNKVIDFKVGKFDLSKCVVTMKTDIVRQKSLIFRHYLIEKCHVQTPFDREVSCSDTIQ